MTPTRDFRVGAGSLHFQSAIRNPRSAIGAVIAVLLLLVMSPSVSAQRPKAEGAPAAVGKVIAYDADKSITVEMKLRGGLTKKVEFVIVKGKTKIDLGGTDTPFKVGSDVRVWADKDD